MLHDILNIISNVNFQIFQGTFNVPRLPKVDNGAPNKKRRNGRLEGNRIRIRSQEVRRHWDLLDLEELLPSNSLSHSH